MIGNYSTAFVNVMISLKPTSTMTNGIIEACDNPFVDPGGEQGSSGTGGRHDQPSQPGKNDVCRILCNEPETVANDKTDEWGDTYYERYYDSLIIHDGKTTNAPVLARLVHQDLFRGIATNQMAH